MERLYIVLSSQCRQQCLLKRVLELTRNPIISSRTVPQANRAVVLAEAMPGMLSDKCQSLYQWLCMSLKTIMLASQSAEINTEHFPRDKGNLFTSAYISSFDGCERKTAETSSRSALFSQGFEKNREQLCVNSTVLIS